jgi:hypothetical protein
VRGGVDLVFEIGQEFRDPASGETWLHFAADGAAVWAGRSRDGNALDPAWQDRFDIARRERVLAIGAVSTAHAWALVTAYVRAYL